MIMHKTFIIRHCRHKLSFYFSEEEKTNDEAVLSSGDEDAPPEQQEQQEEEDTQDLVLIDPNAMVRIMLLLNPVP